MLHTTVLRPANRFTGFTGIDFGIFRYFDFATKKPLTDFQTLRIRFFYEVFSTKTHMKHNLAGQVKSANLLRGDSLAYMLLKQSVTEIAGVLKNIAR